MAGRLDAMVSTPSLIAPTKGGGNQARPANNGNVVKRYVGAVSRNE